MDTNDISALEELSAMVNAVSDRAKELIEETADSAVAALANTVITAQSLQLEQLAEAYGGNDYDADDAEIVTTSDAPEDGEVETVQKFWAGSILT